MSQFALPDGIASSAGVVDRDGVRLAYAVSGESTDHPVTILLLPTWSIIPSRFWKAQVPYLARHYRVVTFDGRGAAAPAAPRCRRPYTDGSWRRTRSRCSTPPGRRGPCVVGLSARPPGACSSLPTTPSGSWARRHRPACGFDIAAPRARRVPVGRPRRHHRGLGQVQPVLLAEGDYDDFLEFFFAADVPRAPLDQADRGLRRLGARDRPGDTGRHHRRPARRPTARCASRSSRCAHGSGARSLVVHGTDDQIRPHASGERLAELTGGELVMVEGAGHGIMARDPVLFNDRARQFVDRLHPPPVPPGTRSRVRAPPVRGGRCTCPRPSAWATPAATWRSPPSCAGSTRTCRSTGSPSTR